MHEMDQLGKSCLIPFLHTSHLRSRLDRSNVTPVADGLERERERENVSTQRIIAWRRQVYLPGNSGTCTSCMYGFRCKSCSEGQ